MNVAEGSMDVKAMVNQEGHDSHGFDCTPLIIAAIEEHTNIVEYLLQHDADVSITIVVGGTPSTLQQDGTQPIPTLYNYYSTRCH